MTDDIAACPHSLAERETAVADGMCPICSASALSRLSTLALPDEIAGLIDHAKQYFHIITRKEMAGEFPQIGLPAYIEKMVSALRALVLENERVLTENDTLRNSVDAVRARYLQGVFDEKARADKLEAERDEAKDDYLRRHKDVGDQMDRRIKAEAERDAIRKAERALSDAYVRLRVMIPEALDTPHAPTSEQIWNITEKALSRYADAIRAKTIEDAKRAIVRARFGPPSHWGGDRPEGWHLDRPCAPEEAAMHDNGCNDAFAAIRALAQTDEGKTETGE